MIYRALLVFVGLSAIVVAGLGVAARYLPIANHLTLIGAAFSPYLMFGGPIAAVLFVVMKRWMLAGLGVCVSAASVATAIPQYVGETADPHSGSGVLRVMTANLRLGGADAGVLTSLAQSRADVLAVQELTPDASRRLSAGVDAAFPYHVLDERQNASGVGLWSRYPIKSAEAIPGYEMAFVTARVQVPGVAADTNLMVAHMPGPWPQPIGEWRADLTRLVGSLRDSATNSAATVVLGDFNSTVDMQPFRELLRGGYHDAAQQAGAGLTPTFPADGWLPPLIAIDHVLTRNCVATTVTTAGLPGSDHRALFATIRIP